MKTTSEIAETFRRLSERPTGGVIGLVDDLLAACRDSGLELDWQADRCRVRPRGGDWEDVTDISLRKSVFRAILARIAVLCNERNPNSVSPYGGQGELTVGADPATIFRVTFANTPDDQRLELRPVQD